MTDGPPDASGLPQVFRLPAVQVAKALMQARQWNEAREILMGLKPGGEEEKIQQLFLLGIAEFQLGVYESAAQRFEAILARQPGLTRVRLELARAYHAMGRDGKARFHFRASLADRLPTSVQDAVESWLDHIDARKRWSASLSFSVLPESNPAKRTSSRDIRIGGVPFRLGEDARAASGTGLLINTGVQYSPVIGEDLRGVVAGSAAGKFFRDDDWNDISVWGDFGVARLFDQGNVSGGIRYRQRWLGGERYSLGLGPWTRGRKALSPKTGADFSISAEHLEHTSQVGLDGWTLRLRTGLDYAFSTSTSSRLEIDLTENDAQNPHQQHRIAGFVLSVSHAFEGGLSVSPGISFQRRRHAAADPLFRKVRRDWLVQWSVNLFHRRLQYRGFAPYIGFSREENRSNIPVNEYVNDSVVIGMSRTF